MNDLRVMTQPDLSADLVPDGKKTKEYLYDAEYEGVGEGYRGLFRVHVPAGCTGFVCMLARNDVFCLVSGSIECTYEGK